MCGMSRIKSYTKVTGNLRERVQVGEEHKACVLLVPKPSGVRDQLHHPTLTYMNPHTPKANPESAISYPHLL